ncbi:MAG: hypothetical protein WAX89_04560 [Alphaproteobacteria bacterium]
MGILSRITTIGGAKQTGQTPAAVAQTGQAAQPIATKQTAKPKASKPKTPVKKNASKAQQPRKKVKAPKKVEQELAAAKKALKRAEDAMKATKRKPAQAARKGQAQSNRSKEVVIVGSKTKGFTAVVVGQHKDMPDAVKAMQLKIAQLHGIKDGKVVGDKKLATAQLAALDNLLGKNGADFHPMKVKLGNADKAGLPQLNVARAAGKKTKRVAQDVVAKVAAVTAVTVARTLAKTHVAAQIADAATLVDFVLTRQDVKSLSAEALKDKKAKFGKVRGERNGALTAAETVAHQAVHAAVGKDIRLTFGDAVTDVAVESHTPKSLDALEGRLKAATDIAAAISALGKGGVRFEKAQAETALAK